MNWFKKKEDKVKTNVPAIDDLELRKKQGERFVSGVEEVGKYFKEVKKQTKINLWLGIGWLAIILILVGGAFIGVAIKSGGVSEFFDNMFAPEESMRRFNCTSNDGLTNDVVRFYNDAKLFKEVFNGSCVLYYQKREVNES